jgi:hypothetical protein
LNNVKVGFMKEDRRPAFVLESVKSADFQHVKAQKAEGVPSFVLLNVEDFTVHPRRSRPTSGWIRWSGRRCKGEHAASLSRRPVAHSAPGTRR